MEEQGDPFRLVYFVITILVVFACLVGFCFQDPDQFLERLTGAGICLGIVVLVFISGTISALINESQYNRFWTYGQAYPIRIHITKMKESLNLTDFSKDMLAEQEQLITTPIFCKMTIASHGLCVTRSKMTKEQGINADPGIPFGLFHRDLSDPLIIPASYKLYGRIWKNETGLSAESANASLSMYIEELPDISTSAHLEIVILFRDYLQKSNLRKVQHLNPPLILTIIAVNNTGDYDGTNTFALYKILYQELHPEPPDEDDSWMYRSRPIYW